MEKHKDNILKESGGTLTENVCNKGEYTLEKVAVGKRATVVSLNTRQPMRRRLLDLGFLEGNAIECIMKSPLGDPRAYLVRGTLIALRREDARTVTVKNEE